MIRYDFIARLNTRKYVRQDCAERIRIPDWISIWAEHHYTSPRIGTLVFVHIRSFRLQYVHHEPMCSVVIGYDNKGDSFYDHDGRWSRFWLRLDPTVYLFYWLYWHIATEPSAECCFPTLRLIQINKIWGGRTIECDVQRLV